VSLPTGASSLAEDVLQPNLTYRLDLEHGRIIGMTDGIDAIKQAVYKILETERYAHVIYSGYGTERRLGPELERCVKEALLEDDRITSVEGFHTVVSGDEAVIQFTVVTIYGDIAFERRVTDLVRGSDL